MNKINGKQKGNSFERKIANILSERFKEYLKIEKGFRRNPDSGSFFGGQNENRTEIYDTDYALFGDLICPKKFKFSIECKHYKNCPGLQSIIDGDIKDWNNWIKQAEQDSKKSNKEMILIIKYNNIKEIIISNLKFEKITPWLIYKEKYCYTLNNFLSFDDNFYFIDSDT